MHCLSTVAVMSFNWLLCKLLMLHYPDDIMEFLSLLPKETQKELDLPELKIVKQLGTCWLAPERCVGLHRSVVKAVKASYSSIVLALT